MALNGFLTAPWRGVLVGTVFSIGLTGAALPARATETAVAPEKNPPGDIPDNQVFVVYKAPQGFSLKVPEGWARRSLADGVSFADKYGEITVSVASSTAAPALASVKTGEAAELVQRGHAVKVTSETAAALKAGPAVKVAYTSNSESSAVTGKRIRLETELFVIGGPQKRAILTLSAPAGADNADQWTLISESFRWE